MSEGIDQKNLDVIVIGAGPAGGQCARELAKLGRHVVLLEHSQEIGEPNYSTAGTPKETIEEFELPTSVLSATWNRIYFASSHEQVEWTYPDVRGYVFDFAALRKFLSEDAAHKGADIMVGTGVTSLIEDSGQFVGVRYKSVWGEGELRAPVIVDATGHWGFVNSQLHLNKGLPEDFVSAMEVQMTAMPQGLAGTLGFYFGDVAPRGYAWVFPMEQSKAAKMGIGSYGPLPPGVELKPLLKNFIAKFDTTKHLEPTEIHGGGGYISPGVKNHVYNNIILIGDAAFQVNGLAYEGIRHAMRCGRLAANSIHQCLHDTIDQVELKKTYEAEWHKVFGSRWRASYKNANIIYHKFSDADWDKVVEAYRDLSPADALEVFFHYRYELLFKHPKLAWLLGKYIVVDSLS